MVLRLQRGEDRGLFAEDGAAWTVHAGIPTLVAGIRALLLQALHPGAMAGVHDWSRYSEDPLGRLSGTVRWVLSLTFGAREQVAAELGRVGRFHATVRGEYDAADGSRRSYSAEDADLVEWVHLAFTDAFLVAHTTWGGAIPGGPDAYVSEWAMAGRLMGVTRPPVSVSDLHARMDGLLAAGTLCGGERVDDVVRFLRTVPLEGSLRFGYRTRSKEPSRRSRASIAACWASAARGFRPSPRPASCCSSRSELWVPDRARTTWRGGGCDGWKPLSVSAQLRRCRAP